jgi:Methyltransferase domain
MSNQNTNLSFDRFSRHNTVALEINSLRRSGQKFTVLDVGGYRGVTREFQPNDTVTILDVDDVSEAGYIRGDGTRLAFKDKSFDFVVNFDVLEHIPLASRKAFLEECWRVCKVATFVATPVKTEANEIAEEGLNALHNKLYKQEHRWLHEHKEFSLPDPKLTSSTFRELGANLLVTGSNEIIMWTLLQGTVFLNAKFTEAEKHMLKLNSFYNSLADSDEAQDASQNYRLVYGAFRSKDDLATAQSKLKGMTRFTQEDRARSAVALINHFVNSLGEYTALYENLYDKFVTKVNEKDFLQTTVDNISDELNNTKLTIKDLSSELAEVKNNFDSLRNSRAQRVAKIANKVLRRSKV